MRRYFTILCLTLTIGVSAQTTKKVCFLGNSYTYFNDLPSLVDSLANHDGNDLIKAQNTPGGYRLNQHSSNALSLSTIASNTWDYVVLQDQSQFPSFPHSQVVVDVYPHAKILSDSIRAANPCAVPLFFNTWGRRDGDPQWDSIDTFTEMNNRLHAAYSHMANVNSGKLSPVGICFRHIYDDATTPVSFTSLYTADGSHPSIFGSYLAGCVFYNMIFETSPAGNTYIPAGLTNVQATYLQNVAAHVVNNVDSANIDYTQPIADFSAQQTAQGVAFTNLSQHGFDYHWDFGDNMTATTENPVHVYGQNGTYNVTLTVSYCGKQDQISQTITVDNLGVTVEETGLKIYPNPTNGIVKIETTDPTLPVMIYNVKGQLIHELEAAANKYIVLLSPGIYIVKSGVSHQKLVVH